MVPKRLSELREKLGFTQEYVGVAIGLDESVARTRISRYENGIHEPDFKTMQRIADVLSVPVAYFYADDDELADYILQFKSTKNKK